MSTNRLPPSRHLTLVPAVVLTLAALAGCTPAPLPVAEQKAAPTASEAPVYKPVVSINDIMVSVIDHNSHILWNAGDPKRAPKNDQDWHNLEHAAVTIAAAGNMILMPGTGPNDAGWVREKDWIKFTEGQTEAALAAMKAVDAKDLKALLAAGDTLVGSCEACHAKFKTDIPKHVAKPLEQPEHFGKK